MKEKEKKDSSFVDFRPKTISVFLWWFARVFVSIPYFSCLTGNVK